MKLSFRHHCFSVPTSRKEKDPQFAIYIFAKKHILLSILVTHFCRFSNTSFFVNSGEALNLIKYSTMPTIQTLRKIRLPYKKPFFIANEILMIFWVIQKINYKTQVIQVLKCVMQFDYHIQVINVRYSSSILTLYRSC